MSFKKAVRKQAKLRLGISAPAGGGKTLGALMVAKGLGGKIAVIDTERGSASLYAAPVRLSNGSIWTPPEFDTMELSAPYTPERFIEAIHLAEKAGYDILIIDSTSHEWNGVGGCMEIVDQLAATKYRGNTWSAFSDVTPRHRKFIDAMLSSPLHIIATTRSKTETAQTDEGGKKRVIKLGMKAEQRDGIEYEFTCFVDLSHDGHYAVATKDRTGVFAGAPAPLSEDTGRALMQWLESGDVAQEPAPADDGFEAPEEWMGRMESTIRGAESIEKLAEIRAFINDKKLIGHQRTRLANVCNDIEQALKLEKGAA